MAKLRFFVRFSLIFILLISVGLPVLPGSLPPPPDSLKNTFTNAKGEKEKALALIRIAEAILSSQDSSAVLYTQEAEKLAVKIKDKHLQGRALDAQGKYYADKFESEKAAPILQKAEALLQDAPAHLRALNYKNLGYLFTELSQPQKVIFYYHKAYTIHRQLKDLKGMSTLSNSLGQFFSNEGVYDSASYYLFRSVKEAELSKNPLDASDALSNLSVMYFQQERYADALPFALKATQMETEKKDSINLGTSLINVGSIYLKLNKTDLALQYLKKAMVINQMFGQDGYLIHTYNSISAVYHSLGKSDSAVYYLHLAAKLSQSTGRVASAALVMGNMASTYYRMGNIKEAKKWGEKAAALFPEESDPYEVRRALVILQEIAEEQGNYKEALRLSKRINVIDSKRFNVEQAELTEKLKVEYEADQAEQQIKLLTQQKELVELKRQRQLAIISVVVALFMALAGFIIWRYRANQKKRETELRTRIAADLHDDVGSLLTQISLQGSLLEDDFYSEEERKNQLSQIGHASRLAVQQMSDVVWAVDARNEGGEQLLNRMRDYAFELMSAAGIEIVFNVHPDFVLPAANLELRQNIYYIFKEALHNTVKHSKATEAQITLAINSNILVLEVKDNGTGKGENNRLSGHGLRNMEMRAEAIGGNIKFSSTDGFAVKLQVPLTRMNMR